MTSSQLGAVDGRDPTPNYYRGRGVPGGHPEEVRVWAADRIAAAIEFESRHG